MRVLRCRPLDRACGSRLRAACLTAGLAVVFACSSGDGTPSPNGGSGGLGGAGTRASDRPVQPVRQVPRTSIPPLASHQRGARVQGVERGPMRRATCLRRPATLARSTLGARRMGRPRMAPPPPAGNPFVYVGTTSDPRLRIFQLDMATGALSPKGMATANARPTTWRFIPRASSST